MWFEIDMERFTVQQKGLFVINLADKILYVSPTLSKLNNISELSNSEYGFAIEVNNTTKKIQFGRDYLGHYPLLYATYKNKLFISDFYNTVVHWLNKQGKTLSLSEQAIALYFALGYIPHGMSAYNEVHVTENASLYCYNNGKIERHSSFNTVNMRTDFSLDELAEQINTSVADYTKDEPHVDIWCSGGLDSSAMVSSYCDFGSKADILTLMYCPEANAKYGSGELRFAEEVAKHHSLTLRGVELNRKSFTLNYQHFIDSFHTPVIDICVTPKFALASATRKLAITGEGGDPLFSGVKNNFMLYMQNQKHGFNTGWLYALSHNRFARYFDNIFLKADQLREYVTEYLQNQLQKYPGDLVRKLFYINTFLKQGSLIFPESYYAAQQHDIKIRHPLTSLRVYKAAFQLADDYKYRFPKGKLALLDIYRKRLPENIIARKKSGTQVPLDFYMGSIDQQQDSLLSLLDFGIFKPEIFDTDLSQTNTLFKFAMITLKKWTTKNATIN